MKALCLISLILVFIFCSAKTQTPVSAYHLDQPLTYNPSLAGSLGEDRAYIGFLDLKPNNEITLPMELNFEFEEPHLDEFRRGVYLSYIGQQETFLRTKASYGIEFQKFTSQRNLLDPTSIGFFLNFHIPILPELINYVTASAGVKYNYIYRRAKGETLQDIAGRELEAIGIDYNEAVAIFSSAGNQFTWSGALHYHKPEKTLIFAGASINQLTHQILIGNQDGAFDPTFENTSQTFGFVHINFNTVIAENLAIELNFLGGFTEHIGGGLTFRTSEETLFRINFSRTRVNLVNDYFTVALNLQNKRCNVNIALTGRNTDTFSPRPNYIIQLGAGYDIGGEGLVSMLRLN